MNKQGQEQKPPYLLISILFIGAFVALLNNSLLNVALPTIMVDFGIEDYSVVQWLATGYMLVSGVLIPASAFLLVRFKNRHVFIAAMSIFTVGTVLAALAPNFGLLLTGRMIQAVGSSVMSPLLMNVMLVSFPRSKRGAVMGVFGLVMITAPAIGPTLSGFIVEYFDWRYLFGMIAPFAVISLLLAVWKLESVMETKEAHLDVVSLILSTIGFGGLLYGFSSASTAGWSDITVYGTITLGVIGIIAFVLRQFRVEEPLVDLRAYRHPMFALSSVISVVISVAMFSGMVLTPAYVQSVREISPLQSGLLMLPGALAMGLMSPITGKLFDKYGPRVLAVSGLSVTAVSTYFMTTLSLDSSYAYIIMIYTVRMIGISFVMMPVMTNGLNQLPTSLNPHGTAINNTVQQVAGAIGTAIFVTIMNSHAATRAQEIMAGTPVDPAASPEQLAAMQAEIGRVALLDGITYTFWIATLVTLVALVLSLFLKRVDVSGDTVADREKTTAMQPKTREVQPN